jgi:hypothetical protein
LAWTRRLLVLLPLALDKLAVVLVLVRTFAELPSSKHRRHSFRLILPLVLIIFVSSGPSTPFLLLPVPIEG